MLLLERLYASAARRRRYQDPDPNDCPKEEHWAQEELLLASP